MVGKFNNNRCKGNENDFFNYKFKFIIDVREIKMMFLIINLSLMLII